MSRLADALGKRYLLSDDYYAALLPLPWKGRELYLPHLGIGRLRGSCTIFVSTVLRNKQ